MSWEEQKRGRGEEKGRRADGQYNMKSSTRKTSARSGRKVWRLLGPIVVGNGCPF